MSGFNTKQTADALADTLIVAVREGWIDHRYVRSFMLYFLQTGPLLHSGRQKFMRHFEIRLAHVGPLKLSRAVNAELADERPFDAKRVT